MYTTIDIANFLNIFNLILLEIDKNLIERLIIVSYSLLKSLPINVEYISLILNLVRLPDSNIITLLEKLESM